MAARTWKVTAPVAPGHTYDRSRTSVSFTTGAYTADDSYVGFEGGVSFEPVGGIGLAFGVSGQADREDFDRLSATARLSFTF